MKCTRGAGKRILALVLTVFLVWTTTVTTALGMSGVEEGEENNPIGLSGDEGADKEASGVTGSSAQADSQAEGGIVIRSLKLYTGEITEKNEIKDGQALPNNSRIHFVIEWDLPACGVEYRAGEEFIIDLTQKGLRFNDTSEMTLYDSESGEKLGVWRILDGQIIFTLSTDVWKLTDGKFQFSGVLDSQDEEVRIDIEGHIITVIPKKQGEDSGWAFMEVDYGPFLKFGTNNNGIVSWYLHYNYDIAYELATDASAADTYRDRVSNVFIVDELGDDMVFTGKVPNIYFYIARPTSEGKPGAECLLEYGMRFQEVKQNPGESNEDFMERVRSGDALSYGYTTDRKYAYFLIGNILENPTVMKEKNLYAALKQGLGIKEEVAAKVAEIYGNNNVIGGVIPAYTIALTARVTDGGGGDYTNNATVFYGTEENIPTDSIVYVKELSGHATRVDPTSAMLCKKDAEDDSAVEGAVFRLERQTDDGDWENYGTYTTDEKGEILVDSLWEGWYRFVEESAAPGYDAGSIQWVAGPNGDGTFQIVLEKEEGPVLEATNRKKEEPKPLEGEIHLRKVDADDTGKALPGAVFQLHRLDDQAEEAIGSPKTTGENGTASWSGLQAGKYRLTEQQAPSGYLLPKGSAAQQEFELREEEGNLSVYIDGVLQDTLVIIRTNSREEPPPTDPPPTDPPPTNPPPVDPPIDPPPTVTPPTDPGGSDKDPGTDRPDSHDNDRSRDFGGTIEIHEEDIPLAESLLRIMEEEVPLGLFDIPNTGMSGAAMHVARGKLTLVLCLLALGGLHLEKGKED